MQKELVIKLADLIIQQSNDLWTISVAMIVIQVAVISHLLARPRLRHPPGLVAFVLSLSVGAYALSLFFGYSVKGALIDRLDKYGAGQAWSLGEDVEVLAFAQILSVGVGLVLFILVFVGYSRSLAEALVKEME